MAASERSQPASLSPRAGLCSWLGGVRGGFFGSQLRLSKVETFLHFRFAEFQVLLDTESRSYNRPNFRRVVDCIVGVIYYRDTKPPEGDNSMKFVYHQLNRSSISTGKDREL